MTENTNPKTRTLGVIDAAKVKKIAGFETYTKAAAALMEARTADHRCQDEGEGRDQEAAWSRSRQPRLRRRD